LILGEPCSFGTTMLFQGLDTMANTAVCIGMTELRMMAVLLVL